MYIHMVLGLSEKYSHLDREVQVLRMFWKFNYLSSDLDNLLDKEVCLIHSCDLMCASIN